MTDDRDGAPLTPDEAARRLAEMLAETLAREEQARAELAARLPRHETITGGLLRRPL